MDVFKKYYLNKKYSFFRDYIAVKKELEKYRNLNDLSDKFSNLESEKYYLNRSVIKSIANMGLLSLSIHRSRKGIKMAKHSLESLSEEEN